MAILVLKIYHFCLYLPEALFNTVNTWFQIKDVDLRNNTTFV